MRYTPRTTKTQLALELAIQAFETYRFNVKRPHMRPLFHFPFPCTQPPSQQPSPTATVPLQPEMSHRPHPAPVRHRRRSPALLSAASPLPGPALTGPRPTVTRSQGARHAAPPSLPRAAARSHRAPSPEYRPAAARTYWARLVRIAPTACRHPRHPPSLSSRCVGPEVLAGKNRTACIPF